MKIKSILAIFSIGLFSIILMACGGAEDSNGETDKVGTVGEDLEDATELTLWTFAHQHVDFFVDGAERWNEEFPDRPIKLVAEAYPYDQMHNNLLLALQSGEGAPDIAEIEIARFSNFIQGEPQLLPLNEYIEPELDNVVESRFEIFSKDGNYYGSTKNIGASVMYYNTEIMDEAGVDIDSIKTWDDFIAAGEKVVENTDAKMINTFPGDHLPYYQLVSQQGSDFADENGDITINRQENIEALQLLVDMQESGIAEVAPGNEPHAEEFYSYFGEGGAAAINMPFWYMGRFTESMPDLEGKIAIRPLPAFEEDGNRSAGMGGSGIVVTNKTEYPDIAKEFVAYSTITQESSIRIWTVLGFGPARHDVWDQPEILEDNVYFQFFGDDIMETLQEVREEINPVNVSEHTPDIINELNTNALNNALRDGSQTPEEALNAAQEAVSEKSN